MIVLDMEPVQMAFVNVQVDGMEPIVQQITSQLLLQ